jgi:hypothetical protein
MTNFSMVILLELNNMLIRPEKTGEKACHPLTKLETWAACFWRRPTP